MKGNRCKVVLLITLLFSMALSAQESLASPDSSAVVSSGSNSPNPAYPNATARELLGKMSSSFHELNYRGTFTYQQGTNMESLRIVHAVIDGKEYERLEYMDGKRRELIRTGHNISCVHPGHQLMQFQPSAKLSGHPLHKGLHDYYRIELADKGRVADHSTINLQVIPRDTHRFGYRLSLDENTGLLLRSELLGAQGKILERFQFVEVTIGDAIGLESFQGSEGSYQVDHVAPKISVEEAAVAAPRSWMVNWLPGGFTPVVANLKFIADDMVTYTDGLAVFSVFLEKDIAPESISSGVEGSALRGATIAYSRALLLAGHPHRVTVVGEIPAQTAKQIAQSVTLVGS